MSGVPGKPGRPGTKGMQVIPLKKLPPLTIPSLVTSQLTFLA